MSDPASAEEYMARYHANQRIEGFGADVRTIPACPFCGAPDWAVWPVMDFEYTAMQTESTCKECGRSGKFLIRRYANGGIEAQFIQTGGPEPPEWLIPKPPRLQ